MSAHRACHRPPPTASLRRGSRCAGQSETSAAPSSEFRRAWRRSRSARPKAARERWLSERHPLRHLIPCPAVQDPAGGLLADLVHHGRLIKLPFVIGDRKVGEHVRNDPTVPGHHPLISPKRPSWRELAPLLEVEGRSGCDALVPDRPDPGGMNRPSVWPGLAANDDPPQLVPAYHGDGPDVVIERYRPQQRLSAQPVDDRRNLQELRHSPVEGLLILGRRPEPDVVRQSELAPLVRELAPDLLWPLGEQQGVQSAALLDQTPEVEAPRV